LTLVLGPVVIVGFLYWLTMTDSGEPAIAAARTEPQAPARPLDAAATVELERSCQERAAEFTGRLGAECRVIVRSPYVLGGDLTEHQLDGQYREIILPTSRALATCYFDAVPSEPVTVLMFSNDAAYQQYARLLDGTPRACYSGYYLRDQRRLMLNLSTGSGTLAHELTHALAHFDFPQMPEWLDEGLASLHEESVFSQDGLLIRGVSNWRLNYLPPAPDQNRLQSIETLMTSGVVRVREQAIDYAQSRYLCLYLQERQVLGPFYRKFRASSAWDPTGIESLKAIFHVDSMTEVEQDFRRWLAKLQREKNRPRAGSTIDLRKTRPLSERRAGEAR
jgi:hypothetical protein